ncbi:FKBP12 interacting protein 37, partial [Perilla frutescens var. frutescens]
MASRDHIDDEDDFGGDFAGGNAARRSGVNRGFGDLDDDEDDIFGSKKGNLKVEETAPGVAIGMILSLRESLKNCQDELSRCQTKLEDASLRFSSGVHLSRMILSYPKAQLL